MTTYNGNSVYLRVNTRDVESLWRYFEMKLAVDKEDVSAGADTEWKSSNSKLKEITGKVTIVYDTTSAPDDVAAVYSVATNHKIPIVYGPEGTTAGKPKDDRDWLVTGINGPSTSVDKQEDCSSWPGRPRSGRARAYMMPSKSVNMGGMGRRSFETMR